MNTSKKHINISNRLKQREAEHPTVIGSHDSNNSNSVKFSTVPVQPGDTVLVHTEGGVQVEIQIQTIYLQGKIVRVHGVANKAFPIGDNVEISAKDVFTIYRQ